ncbi:hypothetical protein QQ020_16160 [Fulvivirgaceae bacterium BMA12]|uniref:Collagen-like protein n=1 Tax=Agaribacillus aureus TaxID=3051825 RepID=A0ABT8L781_9BACT|nr:hypothetical protein [Fulvivirgaceae bacterium BMA12]
MLRNILTLLILSTFAFACTDEVPVPGPPGPEGLPGVDGKDGEEAYTFEWIVDFEDPDYSVLLPFPDDFTMLDSDVALVYALWDTETVDGEELEIWRQLPQNIFTDDGLLQYNFDFTVSDVSVFLDAEFPLSTLGPNFTDDWVLRVVVIPAQFENNGRLATDYSDYRAVAERFGLTVNPVPDKYKKIKRPQ